MHRTMYQPAGIVVPFLTASSIPPLLSNQFLWPIFATTFDLQGFLITSLLGRWFDQ